MLTDQTRRHHAKRPGQIFKENFSLGPPTCTTQLEYTKLTAGGQAIKQKTDAESCDVAMGGQGVRAPVDSAC